MVGCTLLDLWLVVFCGVFSGFLGFGFMVVYYWFFGVVCLCGFCGWCDLVVAF